MSNEDEDIKEMLLIRIKWMSKKNKLVTFSQDIEINIQDFGPITELIAINPETKEKLPIVNQDFCISHKCSECPINNCVLKGR